MDDGDHHIHLLQGSTQPAVHTIRTQLGDYPYIRLGQVSQRRAMQTRFRQYFSPNPVHSFFGGGGREVLKSFSKKIPLLDIVPEV